MRTVTETVDLKKAKLFLENNDMYARGATGTNRPVSQTVVNNYAASMLLGEWRLTHQGLGFDTKGRMKDGQHRMLALVQAAETGAVRGDVTLPPNPKIKIDFQVTYGLPEDIFPFLDTGYARGAGSVLALAGYTNGIRLASASRLLYLYQNFEYRVWSKVKVTNDQVLETVVKTRLDEYYSPTYSLIQIGMINSSAMVGMYLCEVAQPEVDTLHFVDSLSSGANLRSDSPIHVLRNYFIRSRRTVGARRDSAIHLALFIKTWNEWVLGRRRTQIAWKPNTENFPHPLTKDDLPQ